MPKSWLLLDVNNLAYRAFHAMGELSFSAIKTGVVFGILRDVVSLQDEFATDCVAFCFDIGEPRRRAVLPCYKLKRHTKHREAPPEERTARQHMHEQTTALRTDYLPRIGYRNIFAQPGYEADDLIASIVHNNIGPADEAIIVSSDNDLLQLLRHNVIIYSPSKRKAVTLQSFQKQWGLPPEMWPSVKAIAGCSTDEIPGIEGCGEKTAAKFLRAEMNPNTLAAQRITSPDGRIQRALNKRVVRLPLEGTDPVTLRDDAVSVKGWHSVCDQLGMASLRHMSPLSTRAQRHG